MQSLSMYKLHTAKWFILVHCFCLVCLYSCKDDQNTTSSPENDGLDSLPEEYTPPVAYWGFMDTTGRVVITPQFDDVRPFCNGLAVVNVKGKWGAIDHKGTLVVPAVYAALSDFNDNLALALATTGEKYFIDKRNQKVLDCPFSDCQPFKGAFSVIRENEYAGIIDRSGKIILKPVYAQIKADENYAVTWDSDETASLVRLNDMHVMFKVEGQLFLPSENIFRYSEGNKIYYRHIRGNPIAGPFDAGSDLRDGFASVTIQGEVFMLLASGKLLKTPCTQMHYAGQQLWFCRQQDKYYTLLKTAKDSFATYGKAKCKAFTRFSDGLAGCMNAQEKWGYIDTSGMMVIKSELPLAWDAREGRIRTSGLLGYGYLNTRGKEIIPMQFFEARDFYEGKAAFQNFPELSF